jgi:hypothetical protein
LHLATEQFVPEALIAKCYRLHQERDSTFAMSFRDVFGDAAFFEPALFAYPCSLLLLYCFLTRVRMRGALLFCLFFVIRCINAWSIRTASAPDEYWQSIEVAHRMAFG